jgi:hypothetical protein
MHKDGRAIFKFLRQFEAKVIRHSGEPPSVEIRENLRQFARGNISAPERTALIYLLEANPKWIRFLADDVKSLRTEGDSNSRKPNFLGE